jgi:ABC-type sugar transport system ATPase subunit
VMVSSELEELTDHCDRIYVIRDGEIVEVLNRGEVSASELAAMCAHRSTVELSATS